jgi:hypothetical protein
MNTGMLWFDNDPKTTLDVKIQKAAEFYRHKYGRVPDLCMVNPGNLEKSPQQVEAAQSSKILIRPLRSIMPGHLWIGVDEPLPHTAD